AKCRVRRDMHGAALDAGGESALSNVAGLTGRIRLAACGYSARTRALLSRWSDAKRRLPMEQDRVRRDRFRRAGSGPVPRRPDRWFGPPPIQWTTRGTLG